MGGHHGNEIPEVPDWRIYKVENVPQLMQLQKTLACHGLKDNWLRNEVWRYTEISNKHTVKQRITKAAFAGFKYGLIAAVISTVVEKALFSGGHDHDHKEEHGAHAH